MKPHNKKYYGGLTVIAFIILATAFLLQMYGSVDMENIAGLAAEPAEQESVEDLLENGGTVEITYGTTEYTIVYDQTNRGYELQQPGATTGAIISHDFSSYDAVLQDIATKHTGDTENIQIAVYVGEKIFSKEDRVTDTSLGGILTTLNGATETAMDSYNEYYYPELYPTSEQEVTEEPAQEEEADTGDTGDSGEGETGDTGGAVKEYMGIKIDEEEVIIENKGTYWEGKTESGMIVRYYENTKLLRIDINKNDRYDSDEVFTYSSSGVTTTAEEAGDTGETVLEETGEEEDTGYTGEEITFGEIEPEQIAVETTAQEEIIISYKDATGTEYSWDGKITYDSITKTYTIDLDTDPDLVGYTDKGDLLKDLSILLPTATSITLEGIKEGEVVTETANVDNLESLKKVLESAEAAQAATTKTAEAAKETGAKPAATQKAETTGRYSEEDKKFIITTVAGNEVELQMVTVGGKPYGRYVGEKATYYYNKDGKVYKMNNEGELVLHSDKSTLVTGEALKNLVVVLSDKEKTKNFPEDEKSKASREAKKAAEKQQKLTSLATEYGVSVSDITNEEDAINTYLKSAGAPYVGYIYDAATGHYTGGTYGINYVGDNMGITVKETKEGKETTQTVYKEREKGKTTYYVCTNKDCSETEKVKETDALKKQFREAEKEQDRIGTSVGNEVRSGGIQNKVIINGKEVVLKTTIAEAHYLQKQYEQQAVQVKGLLTGYLNKWLDKQLGGWSRGVPAGICAQVFGLEYYKEAGWNRVPMNASSYELQSRLLANSKTVIIEGEKEEITDSLFRYAYTLRLLANQSFEWQTYLYNSCSQETSEEVFYDYGALGAGEYYAFHYAGAAERDMIFDCAQEDCLFDQACVEFTDGSEAVCVSLVHGAGFETPNAGSDYDCQ